MYAIVESGGHQYHAEIGKTIRTEKLAFEVGDTVTLDRVLLIADGQESVIGTPLVAGASVQATMLDQLKGRKIRILKYKPKIRYRVRQGHRQSYSRLRIDGISTTTAAAGSETAAEES